jgi:hypothetical protein
VLPVVVLFRSCFCLQFTSIFASVTDIRCSLPLWDVYLQQGDPFAVFFMALVMLVNAK